MTTPPAPPAAAAAAAATRLAAAPWWRREPYRLLFPLGLLLSWAGVLHWLLHALGVLSTYESVFHSIAQVQGFLICFALGFLLTLIPRRTSTPPPSAGEMAVAVLAPAAITVCAWLERLVLSQVFWLILVVTIGNFALRRFLDTGAARRPPNSFLWIPLALLMGLGGSLAIAATPLLGPAYFWLHDLGRLFLLQGMFVGLVLGVGMVLLPLLTRGVPLPDGGRGARDRLDQAGHVAAALLLAFSFWVETRWSQPHGLALRAVVILSCYAAASLWRPPLLPGAQRRLIWVAAWMIPAGYILAALFPLRHKAGLHVAFIGGFALMALSVGVHVVLAHGGYARLVGRSPWQVPALGVLLLVAMALRLLVDFDPARFFLWLGAAAAVFLAATLAWASLLLPRLLRRPRAEET